MHDQPPSLISRLEFHANIAVAPSALVIMAIVPEIKKTSRMGKLEVETSRNLMAKIPTLVV
jgi:hypothetical protein